MRSSKFSTPYNTLIKGETIKPMDNPNYLIFIISAFALGIVLILSKNQVQPKIRRWLAIFASLMIAFAFGLIIYSFLV